MAYFTTSTFPLTTPNQTRADLQTTLEELTPVAMLKSVADAGDGASVGFLKKTAANTVSVQTVAQLRAYLDDVQELTIAGEVNVTTQVTRLTPAAGSAYALTIANGSTDMQEKVIIFNGAVGSAATFNLTGANLLEWTQIQFSINARSATLRWLNDLTAWLLVAGNAEVS